MYISNLQLFIGSFTKNIMPCEWLDKFVILGLIQPVTGVVVRCKSIPCCTAICVAVVVIEEETQATLERLGLATCSFTTMDGINYLMSDINLHPVIPKNLGFLVTSIVDILLKKKLFICQNKDEKEVGNSSHSNICFDDLIIKSQLRTCTILFF